jgi:hypothetical protein
MQLFLPHSAFLGAVAYLGPSAVAAQLTPSPAYTPPAATSGDASSALSASEQWSNLLGNTLYFYDEQRSGRLPASNRVPWRNDSCLDDGSDVGLDLSGGWYDAGDWIKATFPLSLVISSISWAGIDFGAAFEQSKQTAYLDSTRALSQLVQPSRTGQCLPPPALIDQPLSFALLSTLGPRLADQGAPGAVRPLRPGR